MPELNRRDFLINAIAAAPVGSALVGTIAAAEEKHPLPPLCVFSKHLQFLDYKELAKVCKELGLDGVDLTVRAGGHVLPENVKTDLPRAVEAIRAEGLEVPMITTRYVNVFDKHIRDVLTTAKEQGISYFRIGGHHYAGDGPILPQLDKFTVELRGLSKLADEIGMTAGYHNHSGMNNVGAPLWDLHRMYEAIGSERLGSNFDTGHATVEGAYGNWQITARLLAPWVRMVAVKDFVFSGRKPKWVPLGEGVVETATILGIFRELAGFSGPVSMHFEYRVKNDDAMIEEIGKAATYMREKVYPKAGYKA